MATSYKTPGIFIKEIDKSEVIASEGNSLAGIVIAAKKGPVNRRIRISNDRDYVATFGYQSAETTGTSNVLAYGYNSYAARAHLSAGGAVEVIRAATSADQYAGVGLKANATSELSIQTFSSGIPYTPSIDEDKSDYVYSIENSYSSAFSLVTSGTVKAVFALNGPGANTEAYSVAVETIGATSDWLYAYDEYTAIKAEYKNSPATTAAYEALNASKIVKVSVFSTVGGDVPVEIFYGSFENSLVLNNQSMYLPDVINGNSATGLYVKVIDPTAFGASFIAAATGFASSAGKHQFKMSLTNGVSTNAAASSLSSFYSFFNTSNLAYVVDCNPEDSSVAAIINALIAKKQNLMAVVQSAGDVYAARTKTSYKEILTTGTSSYNDSYAASYTGFKRVKDGDNAKYVYLPNAVSGLYSNALTDSIANPWDAPSGEGRGNVACVDQLPEFDDDDIGQLYSINYNCIKKFPGEGYIVWGQKTRQRKASALDRITTRKTLNVIKKSLASSLKSLVLSANNTPGVRLRTQNNINDYLAGIIAAGGLTAGQCICDDTNNTPQVIDNHILAIDIVIQPVMTIEFVQINIIITRTGVSVTEALVA